VSAAAADLPGSGAGTEERVLLLAPTPKDASMTHRVLAGVGIPAIACATVAALLAELTGGGGAGAVLLTEQAIASPDVQPFADYLRQQPPWSDLPVILLAGGGADSNAGRRAMELLGNVTVLERPVQTASLVSVVRTLIRSRRRQYQIREHLLERERAQAEREALLVSERAARGEAERTSRVKDEFLATLSHELRTPLNAILGWAQILRAGNTGADDLSQGLETIERNARGQAQIIEDLLDMSRIISGKIRLEVRRCDLAPMVEAALDTVRPAADAKGIRLLKDLDRHAGAVSCDAGRLQQVLWNLLSNAIKFTPRGGEVRCSVARVDSHLEVRIADTGEGIRPEFLPHVFDRFRQADASTTRVHGGLGLGLAIVQQLVELHGGTIHASSAGRGLGSTFVVALPVRAVQPADHGEVRPAAGARGTADSEAEGIAPSGAGEAGVRRLSANDSTLRGVRVLVVDDEPDARALVGRLLRDCKAAVTTAGSAAEAFEALRRDPPDVLVSDIGMPGEDGHSLIRRVRRLDRASGGQTPAVALTAYARSEDQAAALSHGFQTHVAKPVEPAELIAIVAGLAGRVPSPGGAEDARPGREPWGTDATHG
jgi:signal transduction histidine kinase/ActR/RegA family two-component response regulator